MAAPSSPEDIREVNTRYHDVAAGDYDRKWGIDFGPLGRSQVVAKLRKAIPHPRTYSDALEIGSGTGYFSLNLLGAGIVERVTCTDVSSGMLAQLQRNAVGAGLADRVDTRECHAERLPFASESFDLVLGHAVLHHIPDLAAAFAEFHRVLRPGGTLFFAGEPSRLGDRLAGIPKRAAARAAPLWRRAMRARPLPHDGGSEDAAADHGLEPLVDVHTFSPGELASAAAAAGFGEVRVSGEELVANWFGWANRTLEASAAPDSIPWLWRQYAYRGYLALQAADAALFEPRLPAAIFYNLLLSARRP